MKIHFSGESLRCTGLIQAALKMLMYLNVHSAYPANVRLTQRLRNSEF